MSYQGDPGDGCAVVGMREASGEFSVHSVAYDHVFLTRDFAVSCEQLAGCTAAEEESISAGPSHARGV